MFSVWKKCNLPFYHQPVWDYFAMVTLELCNCKMMFSIRPNVLHQKELEAAAACSFLHEENEFWAVLCVSELIQSQLTI